MKSLKNPVLRLPLLLPLIGILTSAAFALSFRGQADEPGFSGAYSCQVSASLGKKTECLNAPLTLHLAPRGWAGSSGFNYLPSECGKFYDGTQISVEYDAKSDASEITLKVLGAPHERPLGQTRTRFGSKPGKSFEVSFDSPAHGLTREKHIAVSCEKLP